MHLTRRSTTVFLLYNRYRDYIGTTVQYHLHLIARSNVISMNHLRKTENTLNSIKSTFSSCRRLARDRPIGKDHLSIVSRKSRPIVRIQSS